MCVVCPSVRRREPTAEIDGDRTRVNPPARVSPLQLPAPRLPISGKLAARSVLLH